MVTELTDAGALPLTVEVATEKEPASWVMPERSSDMVAPPGTGIDSGLPEVRSPVELKLSVCVASGPEE